jgi:hypothetical protein
LFSSFVYCLADRPPCQHPVIITMVYALCLIFFKMPSFFSPFVAWQLAWQTDLPANLPDLCIFIFLSFSWQMADLKICQIV